MSRVMRNLAANLAGTAWVAVLQLALVPVFLRLLGVEVFGLIGLYTSLQMIFLLLDLGLGTAVNRELAQLSAVDAGDGAAATLVRTLEVAYLAIAVTLAAALWVCAPWFSAHWVHATTLTSAAVTTSVRLIGLMIAAQFPFALYSGVLLGLQRHVQLNIAVIGGATLRLLGVLPIVLLVSREPGVFFGWQLVATLVQTLATRMLATTAVRDRFGRSVASGFDVSSVMRIRRFAAGLTGVSILSVVVLQLDKLVISKLGSLSALGYYSVASTMAGAASLAAGPVFATIFPRLSELTATRDEEGFARAMHAAAQALSVILMPVCAVLTLFARDVILLWTRDTTAAANAGPLLTLLIVATSANAVGHLPWAGQLSVGWTKFALSLNLVGVALLGPTAYLAMKHYGSPGVAAVVCSWHLLALLASASVTFTRVARGERLRWAFEDVLAPAAVAFLVVGAGRFVFRGVPASAFAIVAVASVAVALTALSSRVVRQSALGRLLLRSSG